MLILVKLCILLSGFNKSFVFNVVKSNSLLAIYINIHDGMMKLQDIHDDMVKLQDIHGGMIKLQDIHAGSLNCKYT